MITRIEVELRETSLPLVYECATGAYQKGDLYCIYDREAGVVVKIPINNIWRIKEYTK